MPREVTARLAPAHYHEKSHREQSRARRHDDKDEEHGPPKILLLSTSTQLLLRRDQDCYPRRGENEKGKGIPGRNYVSWKTHVVPQTKENRSSGGAPQNHPMARIVTTNRIDEA
jgi:hypothetical protein